MEEFLKKDSKPIELQCLVRPTSQLGSTDGTVEIQSEHPQDLPSSFNKMKDEDGLSQILFLTWKRDTVLTICDRLSERQRSAFIVELLGRLPANNRLFLVRNVVKIATVDFISELPDELSLHVLSFLDPPSIITAAQVSKYWSKLINSECGLWKEACITLRITLPHSSVHLASYYKDKVCLYLKYLYKVKNKNGCVSKSVSDVSPTPAHASRTLALSANKERIYSGGDDRYIRCWDRHTFSMISEREVMAPSCLDCTDDIVAAGLYNGCILVYNSNVTHLITTCSRHMGPVYDVKCASDNSFIVSGSSDCTVRIWDLSDNSSTCRHVFRGHETMINRVLLMAEQGSTRIFSLDIACINVWNVEEKKKLCFLKPLCSFGKEAYFQPGLLSAISGVAHDTEAASVIVCGSSHGIYIWDASTYQLLHLVKSMGYVCAESIVGAGSAFVAATFDEGVALINITTGKHEATVHVPQFNNTNCGLWINKYSNWLDGRFEDLETQPLFIVTTLAGDISSFYIKK